MGEWEGRGERIKRAKKGGRVREETGGRVEKGNNIDEIEDGEERREWTGERR